MRGGSIAVVGGSIAGCAAALAASRGGAGKITVFERADAQLRDRGVGIALQSDRYDELRDAGYVAPEMPWAPLTRRVWTVRDGEARHGRALGEQPFPSAPTTGVRCGASCAAACPRTSPTAPAPW